MVSMVVIDRDGDIHPMQAESGLSVMEMLRDNNFDVDGTCGGMGYCASCHVYLDREWIAKLEPVGDIETQTVEGLVHGNENSRLGCQIEITEALDGITLTLAPAEI